MKKKLFSLVLAVCMIIPACFMLVACGEKDEHTHAYGTGHICDCGKLEDGYTVTVSKDNQTTAYKTLAEALVDADNATVKLYADVAVQAPIELNSALVLDLNGKTLKNMQEAPATSGVIRTHADLTVKNGTIHSEHGWGIWAQGTRNGGADQFILNIEATATVETVSELDYKPAIATLSGVTANIYGKLSAVNSSGLSGRGNAGEGDIKLNIKDGAEIVSTNDLGIYMPNTTTLTIDGGKISGATAVYVKSGTTTINGGELNATLAEQVAFSHYNNGGNKTGETVVVEACNYPGGDPTINVNGGTFTTADSTAYKIALYNYNGYTVTSSIDSVYTSVTHTYTVTE